MSEKDQTKRKRYDSIIVDGEKYKTTIPPKFKSVSRAYQPTNENHITAFIPGTVKKVFVKTKEKIKEGQDLLILDAMKMENSLKAHKNGRVKKILVKAGSKVMKNEILIELE